MFPQDCKLPVDLRVKRRLPSLGLPGGLRGGALERGHGGPEVLLPRGRVREGLLRLALRRDGLREEQPVGGVLAAFFCREKRSGRDSLPQESRLICHKKLSNSKLWTAQTDRSH